MYSICRKFVNMDHKLHLFFSLVIRFMLIAYGIHHDQLSEVKYTDVDYKVFTDAARHVLNGNSPYDRHTYRYSPLVAVCLLPNITLHHSFGKILFSLVDIIVAILIRLIVKHTLMEYKCYVREGTKHTMNVQNPQSNKNISVRNVKKSRHFNKQPFSQSSKTESKIVNRIDVYANIGMLMWLYNPLTIAIGTRGNCDSLAGFFVLLTLYVLQCKRLYFIAGLVHGTSIHFRLYPIIYSLTFYMYLSKFAFYTTEDRRKKTFHFKSIENAPNIKELRNTDNAVAQNSTSSDQIVGYRDIIKKREAKTIFKKEYLLYLIPNLDQSKLISGCIISLFSLTWIFYQLYGYRFLHETYIYHLIRKDTRHNFSLYFYLQYLTAWVKNIGIWQKVLMVLPQLVLLLVFSVRYGLNKFSLNFSILIQTIVMVIYNAVLTSQYFVWIMAILPLCVWQIKMPGKTAVILLIIWFAAQAAWLLPAYLLEFHGQNTFLFVWIQSVSFFCANIAILGRFIMYFMPIKDKSI